MALKLPSSDRHFKKTAIKGHYQRHPLFQALSTVIRWNTAIDVGAHIGFITRDLQKFFNVVHSFEPHPDNYACLVENAPGAITHNVALGQHPGRVGLVSPRESNSGAWEIDEGDDVDIRRLDDYELEGVGFIKIDVQGAELQVLKGACETLRINQPTVLMECYQNGVYDERPAKFLAKFNARPLLRSKSDVVFVFPQINNIDMEML